MKINKKPMPIITIYGMRAHVNTNPDFQRPAVWGRAQKQLLIDTILRQYDIPKLYWRRTDARHYEVVDGQQRLRAIWEFISGGFPLPKEADAIDGEEIAGLKYSDLPMDIRADFDTYPLDIIVLEDTDEDEVREMFLRLQNGTSLKAQEKRNAYPGKMQEFVKKVAAHEFFSKVAFENRRFVHDLVAAQLVCLELAGGPTNVKNKDLNKMYDDNGGFSETSPEAKAVLRNIATMNRIFPEKEPTLERYNVVALYCVIAELQKQYVFSQVEPKLHNWFSGFESERLLQELMSTDEMDKDWIAYKEKISHSTDAEDSIRARMDYMLSNLLQAYPSIERKDNQRGFTHLQKLAIFKRDNGHCQLRIKCDGEKLKWDDWHCDHIKPWSKGGRTTVENGQVSCSSCNLSKGNNQEE